MKSNKNMLENILDVIWLKVRAWLDKWMSLFLFLTL